MRLKISKSKNTNLYYVIKSIYIDGKQKTKTVERLGNEQEILIKSNGEDPIVWAKKYIEELNKKEKEGHIEVIEKYSNSKQIPKNVQKIFNGGYLFLQDIYYGLKLDEICKNISKQYKFEYDLNSILSRLIYTRILNPSSKLSSYEASKKLLEQPNFELQHIYRALEVIANETESIEACVYKNSLNLVNRNTKIAVIKESSKNCNKIVTEMASLPKTKILLVSIISAFAIIVSTNKKQMQIPQVLITKFIKFKIVLLFSILFHP